MLCTLSKRKNYKQGFLGCLAMVLRLEGLNLHLRMPVQEGSASGLQHREPHLNPEASVMRSAASLPSWPRVSRVACISYPGS